MRARPARRRWWWLLVMCLVGCERAADAPRAEIRAEPVRPIARPGIDPFTTPDSATPTTSAAVPSPPAPVVVPANPLSPTDARRADRLRAFYVAHARLLEALAEAQPTFDDCTDEETRPPDAQTMIAPVADELVAARALGVDPSPLAAARRTCEAAAQAFGEHESSLGGRCLDESGRAADEALAAVRARHVAGPLATRVACLDAQLEARRAWTSASQSFDERVRWIDGEGAPEMYEPNPDEAARLRAEAEDQAQRDMANGHASAIVAERILEGPLSEALVDARAVLARDPSNHTLADALAMLEVADRACLTIGPLAAGPRVVLARPDGGSDELWFAPGDRPTLVHRALGASGGPASDAVEVLHTRGTVRQIAAARVSDGLASAWCSEVSDGGRTVFGLAVVGPRGERRSGTVQLGGATAGAGACDFAMAAANDVIWVARTNGGSVSLQRVQGAAVDASVTLPLIDAGAIRVSVTGASVRVERGSRGCDVTTELVASCR